MGVKLGTGFDELALFARFPLLKSIFLVASLGSLMIVAGVLQSTYQDQFEDKGLAWGWEDVSYRRKVRRVGDQQCSFSSALCPALNGVCRSTRIWNFSQRTVLSS